MYTDFTGFDVTDVAPSEYRKLEDEDVTAEDDEQIEIEGVTFLTRLHMVDPTKVLMDRNV